MVIKIVREFLEALLGIGGFCVRCSTERVILYVFFSFFFLIPVIFKNRP